MRITYEELRKKIQDNPDSLILLRCGNDFYVFEKYGNRWFGGSEYIVLIQFEPDSEGYVSKFNELEFNTQHFELVSVSKLYDFKNAKPGHTIHLG